MWQMRSFTEHSFGAEAKHFTQVLSDETSYCSDMGPAHQTTSSFNVDRGAICSLAVFNEVKRTRPALNVRVVVKETGLFCCCCVDLFQYIDPEWHQEVLSSLYLLYFCGLLSLAVWSPDLLYGLTAVALTQPGIWK